jgi:midasin
MVGYNIFLLLSVHRQIEAGKESIVKELKDQVKLYRWEQDPYSLASIDNFKRTRHKIFKLLQRFNVRANCLVLLFLQCICWGAKRLF